MPKKIRVLVVEDSLTIRMRLCELVASDPELELAGQAGDGATALELARRLAPDVLSLDMVLPGPSGLEVTEEVMAHFPTPILIVSSSVNRGEVYQTYDALAAGAIEAFDKPRGDGTDPEWEANYLRTLKLVSRIRVMTHLRARLRGTVRPEPGPGNAARPAGTEPAVVAIGASTGGPAALLEVLPRLPAPFPVPVLVVLHVGEPFAWAMADWLSERTGHRVRLARDGEPLSALRGTVLLAPANRHLVLASDGIVRLSDAPERHSCRPSVDVLFESLASARGASTIACLLTGMGRDGAAGLLRIRQAGGVTFAQDEATSIVWGMPGEAVALGAASRVLPLAALGPALAAAAAALPSVASVTRAWNGDGR